MRRLFLVPFVALGAFLLLAGHSGLSTLPTHLWGLPTPMILFVGLSAFIVSMLPTT